MTEHTTTDAAGRVRLICGSAHDLPGLAAESVHAVITSPPYFGLRSYAGEQEVDWPEITFRLNEWVEPTVAPPLRCALGMEPDPVTYTAHLIHCLREWRRVLHPSGTVWLNLGDSFSTKSTHAGQNKAGCHGHKEESAKALRGRERRFHDGLKEKDLAAVPWLVAMAARADGWYLRTGVVWAKAVSLNPVYTGQCMPDSTRDRPGISHEYIFLLAKEKRYFFDMQAVREPAAESSLKRIGQATFDRQTGGERDYAAAGVNANRSMRRTLENFKANPGRNLRSVWTVNPKPAPKGMARHFAMWPPALVEPMVKVSTSAHGCCARCGAPYVRIVEKPDMRERPLRSAESKYAEDVELSKGWDFRYKSAGQAYQAWRDANPDRTVGWAPSCTCESGEGSPVIPCTVLDPFCGSGTTLEVALRLGRRAVGVDISREYLETLVPKRLNTQMALGVDGA